MRAIVFVTIALCGADLSGCATITQGTSQSIAIATPPAVGADCLLTGNEGTWSVTTPGVTRVQKSKEDIAIHCRKSGWQDASAVIPSSFQGWTLGNFFIGGVIGVGIDAVSGASNQYPHVFNVAMTPLAGTMVDSSLAAQAALPSDAQPRVDTSGVNLQPAYPDTARRLQESGSVVIRALVRDDGTVKKVSLGHSSGYSDLDDAAANAVMHWKFLPAMESGEPVSGEAIVQITFQPPAQ